MLQSQGELTMVSARDFRTDPFSPPPSARLAPSNRAALRPCAATCVYSGFTFSNVFFGIVKPTFSPPAALCALAGRSDQRGGNHSWVGRKKGEREEARTMWPREGWGRTLAFGTSRAAVGARMAKLLNGSTYVPSCAPCGV